MNSGLFGSTLLEVLIGLLLLYLVLSMMASAINEAINNFLNTRSKHLASFVEQFLRSDNMVKKFFLNSVITPSMKGTTPPSYIKAEDFAHAVLETLLPQFDKNTTIQQIQAAVENLPPDSPLRKVLGVALQKAGEDTQVLLTEIQTWFDSQMERVSGWFKRQTHTILLAIGLGIAVIFNVDSVAIANALLSNPTLRQALIEKAKITSEAGLPAPATQPAQAGEPSLTFQQIKDEINELGIPLGWSAATVPANPDLSWLLQKIIGILATVFAISQGAPFWFDMLNKVTNLRSTDKPPEKAAT